MLTLPTTTQEYIDIPLTAWAGDVADPTTLPVEIAVIPVGGEPADTDYKPATWATTNGARKARILWRDAVPAPQPGAIYTAWLRITSTAETPVLLSGSIRTL